MVTSSRVRRSSIFSLVALAAALLGSTPVSAEIQLPAVTNAPAASGPSMWFTAQDVPALQGKRTDPLVQAFYQQTKAYVDGRANSSTVEPVVWRPSSAVTNGSATVCRPAAFTSCTC